MPRNTGHLIYRFNEAGTRVTRPFKKFGEVALRGHKIRMFWAIDDANQCWMSDWRGEPLDPVDADTLIRALYRERQDWDQRAVEGILGVPMRRTKFEEEALSRGWTPPASWEDLKGRIKKADP